MPRTHTGRISNFDNLRSQRSVEETEPIDSSAKPSSQQASRASKSALLQHPPWEALKPRSKVQKSGNVSGKSERRKRSRSPATGSEAHQSRTKKSKLSLQQQYNHHGRPPRAPTIDANEDADGRFNDSGEEESGSVNVNGSDEDETSSVEEVRDDVSPELLKSEEAKIVFRGPRCPKTELHPSTPFSNPDCFSKARSRSTHPSTPLADVDHPSHRLKSRSVSVGSHLSTPASDSVFAGGPPTSSDFDPTSEHSDIQDGSKDANSEKGRWTSKLENKRPIIRTRQLEVATSATQKQRGASKNANLSRQQIITAPVDSEDNKLWMECTALKIYMRSKNTAAIGLKDQNVDIQAVIHTSYEFGKFRLAVGNPDTLLKMSNDALLRMTSPFAQRGLEVIAHTALIDTADHNGYNGEYDIAHRLEDGSVPYYIEPLQGYVAHRLGLYRSGFKKCILLIAPGILGLPTNSHQHNSLLLSNNSFIYPWSEEAGFNISKPFQNPVIAKCVEGMFFTPGSQYNALGLEYAGRLASSLDTQPGQCEVSIFMVALASVGVASVIQDTILGRATDFAGPMLDSLFKKFVVILVTLRCSKPKTYHRLMHGIYTSSVGEKPVNVASSDLTAGEILGEINWDLIDE